MKCLMGIRNRGEDIEPLSTSGITPRSIGILMLDEKIHPAGNGLFQVSTESSRDKDGCQNTVGGELAKHEGSVKEVAAKIGAEAGGF